MKICECNSFSSSFCHGISISDLCWENKRIFDVKTCYDILISAFGFKMFSCLQCFDFILQGYMVQFSLKSCISRKIIVSYMFPFACPTANFCHHQIIHKSFWICSVTQVAFGCLVWGLFLVVNSLSLCSSAFLTRWWLWTWKFYIIKCG